MNIRTAYLVLFLFVRSICSACQCPVTSLSLAECNKYEIIFQGRIDSVRTCNRNFGEAFFTVDELYKG
ncbi:MAG: hypothetical protein K0S12_2168, partial [Bacteroidetes bacterium]|nr:hypothetical protein [Bacteroidota bacterium]